MNHLHLQVNSGLCSRLRPVVGAIAYCEATNRRLIVDWPTVEPSEQLGVFPPRMCDLWVHPYNERPIEEKPRKDFPALAGGGNVVFRSCHIEPFLSYFREPIASYLDRMQPTEAVKREMIELPTDRPVIGVNIRYSLKQPGAASPEWFIERMRQFPDRCLFFCSFDSREMHDLMHRTFPGRILTTNKDYRYDFNGIVRTTADLYLLARCDWMIGSNYSSYSQMAAFMRGATYRGSHEKPNGINGGRYEDAWNSPNLDELDDILRRKS